jgi:D-3-phosphoglycerate dehydrogenase
VKNKLPGGKQWIVGITDFVQPPVDIEQAAFPEAEFRFLSDWRVSEESREEWSQVDALLVWHWKTDRATAELLDKCKITVRYGAGYDVVDVAALTDRGIVFCNTPGCGTQEVADTTCAMILALQRKLVTYDRDCRTYTDRWQKVLVPIQRISEQTLGIIGGGRIGSAVIERMKPFGYRILLYDPHLPEDGKRTLGCEQVESLAELLREADIISIHCPLTIETRGMVNAAFLSQMKPGSSLVNTARGGIFADLDCLEEALRTEHLASIAMDVLPDEPPKDHPLLRAWRQDEPWLSGRLIITPHTADYSERGWYEVHSRTAETARMFLIEGKVRNQITA